MASNGIAIQGVENNRGVIFAPPSQRNDICVDTSWFFLHPSSDSSLSHTWISGLSFHKQRQRETQRDRERERERERKRERESGGGGGGRTPVSTANIKLTSTQPVKRGRGRTTRKGVEPIPSLHRVARSTD